MSQNEDVLAHCASKRGNEAGQCVYSRWRGWCPLCKKISGYIPTLSKMRRYRPTVQEKKELRLDSLHTVDGKGGAHCCIK